MDIKRCRIVSTVMILLRLIFFFFCFFNYTQVDIIDCRRIVIGLFFPLSLDYRLCTTLRSQYDYAWTANK